MLSIYTCRPSQVRCPNFRQSTLRLLGYGKHWQTKPKNMKKRQNQNAAANRSRQSQEKGSPFTSHTPPTVLLPTASPHVFVAEQAGIDNADLFQDVVNRDFDIPTTFTTNKFEYFASAKFNHDLPNQDQPEVAFLGRSNVGKSSLINALMRNKLARISKQPGRTQQAHFFGLVPNSDWSEGNSSWDRKPSRPVLERALGFLVDLPGYGYAVGPDKVVDRWQQQTQEFILHRRDTESLKRLYLLFDSRHGMTSLDRSIMTWMDEAEIPYTIVWTKIDQASGPPQVLKCVNEACIRYASLQQQLEPSVGDGLQLHQSPVIHVTSSKARRGIAELLSSIEADFFASSD